MELKGKTVLVTGASSGIGQVIAVSCAKKGARVVIGYRKNKAGAEQTLTEVQKYSKGHIIQADLTQEEHVKKMFAAIASEVGPIDVLVNNAGEAHVGNVDDFFDNTIWRNQFENIFFSALFASQQFLKQNADAPLRKIMNISTVYGNPGSGKATAFAYSTAKAALSSMTATLAKINPRVLVNAIAPGYTWTPAWEGISDEEKKQYEERTIIGRYCTPEEIAHMAIAALENDAVTGQVITIDGGLFLKHPLSGL
ncbi:MAG: SDR family oxidoreductase [Patescibacteria group bacterium]